jgi:hypothetical protein
MVLRGGGDIKNKALYYAWLMSYKEGKSSPIYLAISLISFFPAASGEEGWRKLGIKGEGK